MHTCIHTGTYVYIQVFACAHEAIADTFVEVDSEGVRSYDSIEAETFVLPSGDKKRDTEMAARHCTFIYVSVCVCVYIYIYIHM